MEGLKIDVITIKVSPGTSFDTERIPSEMRQLFSSMNPWKNHAASMLRYPKNCNPKRKLKSSKSYNERIGMLTMIVYSDAKEKGSSGHATTTPPKKS